jgi:hypothetical protein
MKTKPRTSPLRTKTRATAKATTSPVRIVSISLPADLAKKIKLIAFTGNTSVSGLVERALSVYIGARSNEEVARRLNREGITHKRRY